MTTIIILVSPLKYQSTEICILTVKWNWFIPVIAGIFYQLFTIHIIEKNVCVPRIFALLPNKTELTYNRLFDVLKRKLPLCEPETVMLDFEKADKYERNICFEFSIHFQHIFPWNVDSFFNWKEKEGNAWELLNKCEWELWWTLLIT